jgi:dTDP-4-dehydrorhamnose reductase
MKILILGSSGMIGRTMFHVLAQCSEWQVYGSIRSKVFNGAAPGPVVAEIDLTNHDHLDRLFAQTHPDVVVNCAGLTKHLPDGNAPISALTMNALLPHRLAQLCEISKARLIHVSTDCVFSGAVGKYVEQDATDLLFGYQYSDITGDGASDGADMNIVELNTGLLLFEAHP